jgi:leucine dehydrogenase
MGVFEELARDGHEQVLFVRDDEADYRAIVAIHSTRRGPAIGGTRVWHYTDEASALQDALRLSKSMSYKAAAADLPYGGGKSVILARGTPGWPSSRERLFRAHGRAVERLAGRYITGPDVGSGADDMVWVRQESRYVDGVLGHSGDPAPHTAHGVHRAMQAVVQHLWASESLHGRTVSIQGCGHVGTALARRLRQEGARLVVADVDPERASQLARETDATTVGPDEIFDVEADMFAPCALGGCLTNETIARLRTSVVVPAANNVLADLGLAEVLDARGITSVPDYIANAGGLISGAAHQLGWDAERMHAHIEGIYDSTANLLDLARREHITTWAAAERIVRDRL